MKLIQSYSLFDENEVQVRLDHCDGTPLIGIVTKLAEGSYKATTDKGESYVVSSHQKGVEYLIAKLYKPPAEKKLQSHINQQTLF